MEKYIIKNGIKYELCGDVYYPMLKLDEQTNYQIGKYGCLHLDYIKQHHTCRCMPSSSVRGLRWRYGKTTN